MRPRKRPAQIFPRATGLGGLFRRNSIGFAPDDRTNILRTL
jgi:hypothetical protein